MALAAGAGLVPSRLASCVTAGGGGAIGGDGVQGVGETGGEGERAGGSWLGGAEGSPRGHGGSRDRGDAGESAHLSPHFRDSPEVAASPVGGLVGWSVGW